MRELPATGKRQGGKQACGIQCHRFHEDGISCGVLRIGKYMLGGCVSKSELENAIVKVLDFRLLMVLWMAREAACAIEDIRMGMAWGRRPSRRRPL